MTEGLSTRQLLVRLVKYCDARDAREEAEAKNGKRLLTKIENPAADEQNRLYREETAHAQRHREAAVEADRRLAEYRAWDRAFQESHRPTLRDQFAAHALTGLVSSTFLDVPDVARLAYQFADAMLAARGEKS